MARKKQPVDIYTEMANALDRELLDWVKRGKLDPTEDDPDHRRQLTAAEIKAVIERLRSLGIQSPSMPGTAGGNLVAEAERRGLTYKGEKIAFPPVDLDADDRATRTGG